jgi:hypothetical protein
VNIVASTIFLVVFLSIIPFTYIACLCANGFANWGNAAFFMPLAPQSILDWDQAYSLLVGVILLVGVEIYPAVRKYREGKRLFREDMDWRMDEARGRRGTGDSVSGLRIRRQVTGQGLDVELADLNREEEPDDPLPIGRRV